MQVVISRCAGIDIGKAEVVVCLRVPGRGRKRLSEVRTFRAFAGEITVHDNRVVVDGRARDKAGGKTRNADKTISIDRTTLAALRRWRERQNGERELLGAAFYPGDYVFTFEDGRPPHPDTIRQRFDRLAAAAGLSRITFHDLRHSYATSALKAGLSPKVVSERIGHANVGFFLETYAHVLKNDDRDAAEQAASFW